MNATNEFVPAVHFTRILRWWWVVVLVAVAGGAAGLGAHRLQPPQYEAQAVFMASIDFNKIDFYHPPAPTPAPYRLTQYDEDLALAVVEAGLRAAIPQVLAFANQKGLALDVDRLKEQSIIERNHALWVVGFREKDPALAQAVTNYWADSGYAILLEWQKIGKVPVFVMFDLVQKAELPKAPAFFHTNSFVLAGSMIGLVAGVVLVNLPFFKKGQEGRDG